MTRVRIALLKPCCIGDIVLTTPLLCALRRAYPDSPIDWWAGSWSLPVVKGHPSLTGVVDTGPLANPASNPGSLLMLIRSLRAGHYGLLVVPDRSRLISLAALLSAIPQRVGLDSGGRGFGYTLRVPVDPKKPRHEAEIYLDLARALHIPTGGCWANVTPRADAAAHLRMRLEKEIPGGRPLILVHPGGGVNPGMSLPAKRWPAERFAALAVRAAGHIGGHVILLGGAQDGALTGSVRQSLGELPFSDFTGQLTIPEIAALAADPRTALYVGNDNGIAHMAAAAGARVLMVFGPSDPIRYAPFVPPARAAVAWHPIRVPEGGVAAGGAPDFDWERDGVTVSEAWEKTLPLLEGIGPG